MRMIWGILFVAAWLNEPALAQQGSAYDAGLRVAQRRGYANADCYARVFAKHAVVIERPGGGRGWHASSTPAYNAEQRSRCGIDRLEDLAARREAGRFAAPGAPRPRGGIHGLGMKVAAERGYSGSQATCFARVYATYASPQPAPSGKVTYAIAGASMHAYTQDLFQRCGISR
ncbi:MAG: hypothetical protein J0I42_01480 [Bosea sp.]|uniref:hypothetical protein n=1 Tax=Bosea sp. (in: a-proteobacteria) TaxID=1871050 RepID=UPI001AC8D1D9|nr:hypothetical protein [Bosea sp. (in: a-proteobacteria)]MBN9450594.1 hypothetical protein [Bosea sp. (in: a-proteobacteria)]